MEGFLDDLPTLGHSQESEHIGHVCSSRARHGAGPSRNFQTNHSDGIEYVDADKARLYIDSRTVLVDPVEKECRSHCEIGSDITKECSIWVKSGAHQFTLALLASIDVELHRSEDCVVFGRVVCSCHAFDLKRA